MQELHLNITTWK